VEISWGRVTVDDADFLELRWGEFGGPAVEEPNHRGFGRTLIERLVPRAIEGSSDLVFAPDGLRWSIRFPVSRLVLDA
ncbi:MAG: histidine kinase, partial [Ancalomicrobiaceae bacterium]|nr:histidine kinase [Ancalomicrobiaceae bacterium]